MTFHNVVILIKSVWNKDKNNYYYNIFLEKASYELRKRKVLRKIWMLYYNRIDTSKKMMLIKQVHQKSAIFVTIGIFQIKGLSFKLMHAIDAMIY